MNLTDIIERYLQSCPYGATTAQIKAHCHAVGYINRAESETKNIGFSINNIGK